MLQLPSPTTPKQLRTFLRLTVESGYCRIWISNYGLIAQPLYESLKGWDDSILLTWGTPQKKVEATPKQNLTQAPALRLSDPETAFQLYVHEKKGIDLGVLTQRLGLEPQACSLLIQEVKPSCPRLTSLPSKSCSYCSPALFLDCVACSVSLLGDRATSIHLEGLPRGRVNRWLIPLEEWVFFGGERSLVPPI